MSVFAFIELKLNRTTQILIGHIAQNIFGLNNSPKIGKRLRKTIRWKTVGEPLYDDMGRCCTFFERLLYMDHRIPLFLNDVQICRFIRLAEMERELIIERTRAGLDAAKQLGRKGGRKPKMTSSKIESAKKLLASGIPPRDVAKDLGVSVPTLYRWLPASKHS